MSQPSLPSMKDSNTSSPGPKLPPPVRPRIIIPGNQSPLHYNNNPLYVTPGINMQPMTPVNPIITNDPFGLMYPTKASDFMFKQFSGFKDFTMNMANSGLSVGEKSAFWMYNKVSAWSKKWFTHMFLFLVIALYSAAGAAIFVAVEAPHEQQELKKIRHDRIEVIKELWDLNHIDVGPGPDPEDRKMGKAVSRLLEFEKEIITNYVKGIRDKGELHADWTFWNALFYCGTIYTTIGYGHITPATTTGRAITIIYAIFGIPMFLILLADFGKLFTRCIKFVWAFVRRLYYTGSCRKVRKNENLQDVMKGVQMVYEIATFRRPSQLNVEDIEITQQAGPTLGSPPMASSDGSIQSKATFLNVDGAIPKTPNTPGGENTPCTPAPSNFAVDDEFNLPVSVAIFILLLYIVCGALIYWMWENWSFFESFYFVFISMSTIGFGDFVPQHPMYMMASILYLVFGLALTSMCINVVQVKLSDTFRQASAKIGATIGLAMAEDDGSITQQPQTELAEVHTAAKKETKFDS
ncbi:potassium channel subfamily K member 18 isoform X2 [Chrysoperla carnea]|uniref:potassium channel subfamily K member 18 isoform X2 n=1 Tax=Chrysoperla carnea TaxID=189513 RepID=UPI001D092EB7|nr:potassium channel subfamily K member 18 isoform X2 [Chrysoperla carnea]